MQEFAMAIPSDDAIAVCCWKILAPVAKLAALSLGLLCAMTVVLLKIRKDTVMGILSLAA